MHGLTRPYDFGVHLKKEDYKVRVFSASYLHYAGENLILDKKLYIHNNETEVPFTFIKTSTGSGNGIKRIFNMVSYYRNLFKVTKKLIRKDEVPDLIIASSPHLLTPVAGIKIGKKINVPCFCEIRDLWPESIMAYGLFRKNNLIARILYKGEKWIYKKADQLMFTMEGGKDYIIEHGWDTNQGGPIDINKVHHINNGVDLEKFNYNKEHYQLKDEVLEDTDTFKIVYTGSIRLANNIQKIADTAFEIKKKGVDDIKFIIFGDGTDRVRLEKYCKENDIDNIFFKGFVNKKYIPYILSRSDLNIFHFEKNGLEKYGASLNKIFEYFASGRPTISDAEFGYDIINRYGCGVAKNIIDPKIFAQEILKIKNLDMLSYNRYCDNALKAANDYDFKKLTNKLIKVIEGDI